MSTYDEEQKVLIKRIKAAVFWIGGPLLLFICFLIFAPFKIIGAGERGITLRLGAVQDKVLEEGIHWRTPIVESVIAIDVQTQKIEVDAPSFSKDLQNVDTKIALNFHLDPQHVNKLWQEIGSDYADRIIAPAIQESVKAATAQFTAEQLVSERPKVKDEILIVLKGRLAPRYISVDDFSIVNFTFSEAYEKAIEEKQVAQQQSLKAENELTRIKVEAQQKIATAQADAESIKIQAQAVTQQGGKDYVQLQAIKRWDGKLPTQMIPGSTVPFLNLNGEK